jgi:hypothetical protein
MSRLYHIAIPGLFVLALVLVLPLSTVRSNPLPANQGSPFGINSHIASRYRDPSTMDVPATTIEQLGVGWVREDFQMSRIVENGPDSYSWDFHDNAIDELSQRGINIIGILGGPVPTWANPSGGFHPPSPETYANFCRAVVSRYKDRVHHWEIWNEPADTNGAHWSPAPDAAAYTALLKAAYRAIKETDGNAKVLVGGDVSPEPSASFLQQISDHGGWNSFDIVSIHPYVDDRSENASGSPESGGIAAKGLGQIQALVQRLGTKPIWVTEFGWSTGGSASHAGQRVYSEEDQAAFLVRGSVLLRAGGAERVLAYTLKDEQDKMYGLVGNGSNDGDYSTIKPAFSAFKTLNQQLAGAAVGDLPSLVQRDVVIDFRSSGSWQRGDEPYGTFESGRLSYNFPAYSTKPYYVVFLPSSPPTISGNPSQVGILVNGDNSSHSVNIWLRDAKGRLQFRLGPVGGAGNELLVPINSETEDLDRPGTTRRIEFPAQLIGVVLEQERNSPQQGTIELTRMIATSGPEAYGARFTRGGETIDVLWSSNGGSVPIGTSSTQGTLVDMWGTSSTISANNGQFTLNLGPNPVYLHHTPGTPAVVPAPQPATPTEPPTPTETPTQGGGEPAPGPTTPPTGEQDCFDATGYCIHGRIRDYWHANGGLSVFGYPIGPQQEMTIEGKTLQAQWFERNRLEIHPENQPPYDVLLGRLSEEILLKRGHVWQEEPKSAPQSGCRYFEETGFNVCGEIFQAWRRNGLELDGRSGKTEDENTALFGLPIGEARMETIEGNEFLVQWFERARFEVHPENAPPHNVLLGLLGNEIQGN